MATVNRKAELASVRETFIGRPISDLPTPSVVVDRRVATAHCERMLSACRELGVQFRAHIKTHKTLECTKLQVGEHGNDPIRIVASTLPEIALVLPWLVEQEAKGREVDILYSMPLPYSSVSTLNQFASAFHRHGHVAIMIDHPSALEQLSGFAEPPLVFLKLDTGTHRAGLEPKSSEFAELAAAALQAHHASKLRLLGVYSHASHSYAVRDAEKAMRVLLEEIHGCQAAVEVINRSCESLNVALPELTLSVGATPSATAAQNLLAGMRDGASSAATELQQTLDALREKKALRVELHAGVYPFLDLQQLVTQAAPSSLAHPSGPTTAVDAASASLAPRDIAMTVLAEVTSVYPHRQPPQALIAAGVLALGREPCPRYSGWGAISSWGLTSDHVRASAHAWGGTGRSGWVVGKVAQEHGVVFPEEASGWEGADGESDKAVVPFTIGQKVRVLPNHACITGAGYPWYFVVDGADEIVDVWARCQGW